MLIMNGYIIALDQGTTSSRSIIFDSKGNIVSLAQYPFTQIYPKPGWVEHDPMVILESQMLAMSEAFEKSGLSPTDIAGIGITNQRETTPKDQKQGQKTARQRDPLPFPDLQNDQQEHGKENDDC